MGFIVQQPNGRYCRFSTVVDCPVIINMTREDYINYLMESNNWVRPDAVQEANEILTHYVRPFSWLDSYFVDNNMTMDEYKRYKRIMAEEPTEGPIYT